METRPLFNSVEQAVGVLWHVQARIAGLIGWALIAIAHVALIQLLLALAWCTGTQLPEAVVALRAWSESTPASVLGAVGVSAGTLLTGWVWLMRRLHQCGLSAMAGFLLPKPVD